MSIQYTPSNLINKITANNYTYTHSVVKKITETDTGIEKLQDKIESFRKNIRTLKNDSPDNTSKARLEKHLTAFIKSYNEIENNSDNITDKEVKKQLSKLKDLFSDNEKALKKIGITKNNGKYSFDSDVFEDANDSTIKSLLVGHDSFIAKADKIMRKLEENADAAVYSVVEQNLTSTAQYDPGNIALANQSLFIEQTLSSIKEYNNFVQSDTLDANTKNSIMTFLSAFSASVYNSTNTSENESIDKLNQLCRDNEQTLARLGLTFDSAYENLTFNTNTDMNTDDFKTAYNELFGENAAFGNKVSEYCKNIFSGIIQPEKLGVSVIDAQV